MLYQDANLKIDVSLDRIEKNVKKAQFYLDNQVMNSMIPYMPMRTGSFINLTRAKSSAYAGTGRVYAGVSPMGRYLYEGKVMVNIATGKGPRPLKDGDGNIIGFRFPKGSKLQPTTRPLTYSRPSATPRWFDTAKAQHKKQWVSGVKKIIGGK